MRTLVFSSLLLLAAPAEAQHDEVESLQARVSEAPDDASLRCQLSFALVGAQRFQEALDAAEAGILALRASRTPAARRTLGACHYNRGRAVEGLGHRPDAIAAYVDSLTLRPNDTVLARLQSLVPGTPAEYPAAALIALDGIGGSDAIESLEGVQVSEPRAEGRGAQRLTWRTLVLSRTNSSGSAEALLYAFVESPGARTVWGRIDSWTTEEAGTTFVIDRVSSFRARGTDGDPPLTGLVITARGSGGSACGAMDGFRDLSRDVTVLVRFEPGSSRIHARTLVTTERSCGRTVDMRLRVRAGDVVVTRSRGGSLEVGTHSIASLL